MAIGALSVTLLEPDDDNAVTVFVAVGILLTAFAPVLLTLASQAVEMYELAKEKAEELTEDKAEDAEDDPGAVKYVNPLDEEA